MVVRIRAQIGAIELLKKISFLHDGVPSDLFEVSTREPRSTA